MIYRISENSRHGLAHGAVPIVYADLSKEAQEIRYPPNSFISTYDFKSPAELAQYLYDLDHHDRAYKQSTLLTSWPRGIRFFEFISDNRYTR